MYVGIGASGCNTHADCPGEDMYCEDHACVYKPVEEMAHCNRDEECDMSSGYYCVANVCGKLPPEYYPTTPKPSGTPPAQPTPTPAGTSAGKPDLTFLIVAAAVVGGLAYLMGRQS
jgi:hypothetical protein